MRYADPLIFSAPDVPNLPLTNSYIYAFALTDFTVDFDQWGFSEAIAMEGMFYASNFDQAVDNWDVSNVEIMDEMFQDTSFNQPLN